MVINRNKKEAFKNAIACFAIAIVAISFSVEGGWLWHTFKDASPSEPFLIFYGKTAAGFIGGVVALVAGALALLKVWHMFENLEDMFFSIRNTV